MQPILTLSENLTVTASGKAYVLDFQKNSKRVRTWVALSQSKVEAGKLWVADWILESGREGVGSLIHAGYKCLQGTIEQLEAPRGVVDYQGSVVTKGFFTVQRADEKHLTFRVKTTKSGKTLIGLLVGRNNITDYCWFAFVDGGSIRRWRTARYRQMAMQAPIDTDTANECLKAILGDVEGSGKRFATMYKNCSRCGKVLTTPGSLERGLGPECAGLKYGGKR